MLMKLINWVRGVLTVSIRGDSPERFINLCSNKKIFIWNIISIEDEIRFKIIAKKYKSLKPVARKTGIVPKIVKKSGLPFLKHRYRKRYGFFAGVLICALLIYILSLFIWDISVLGGSKYTPQAMLKFLKENQVYAGIRKKDINCQEIEETMRLTYKDIGWVSAEIKGTRLIIKITETNMPAPAQKTIAPSHMIATKNAIVKSIVTRSGTPLVKEGSVVKKGDILVSGILAVKGDFDEVLRYRPTIADADILCRSFYDYYEAFKMTYIEEIYTGKDKKGYFVAFANEKLFLYNPSHHYDKYDIIVNENTLHITDSFYLPFRFGSIKTREYYEEVKTYTEEEAVVIAGARLQRYFARLSANNVIIIENNVRITIENNHCIASGRVIVEEPAWEYKTISEDEWRIKQTDEHNGNNY